MAETSRFEEKVVVVTGAGSGIGRATSVRLASEGAKVFGMDVSADGLNETKNEIESSGGAFREHLADVSRRDECFAAVAAAVESFGRLDVLCNVAGVVRFSHAHETSEEDWQSVIGVNLSGTFFMAQAAIPHLLESEGNIVNIASNAGLMGQAYTVAYCASKGGVVLLTKALAMEYMKRGIRINAVAPGGTDTNIARGRNFPEDIDFEMMGRYRGMRGINQVEDVAGLIAYVASDEARFVHGAILSIDQGVTAG
ncbi:SDR family oxidoreductase [Myxococcota bacterium]|nr:SDR family oxidoreductase [Myxococcota bacterium]